MIIFNQMSSSGGSVGIMKYLIKNPGSARGHLSQDPDYFE